jgi:Flp pilus assembly protein TadD
MAAVLGGVVLSRPLVESGHTARLTTFPRHLVRSIRILAVAAALGLALTLTFAGVAEIPLRLSIVSLSEGDLSAAGSELRLARVLRPWDGELDVVGGHALAAVSSQGLTGAADAAEPLLRRAAASLPRHEAITVDLASIAEDRRDYKQAGELLDEVLRTDPFNPYILLRRSVISAEQGDFAAAEEGLLEVTRIDTLSPEPWRDLELVYEQLGRQQEAEAAARQATVLSHG